MKKILFLTMLFCCILAKAQSDNFVYCELVGQQKGITGTKVTVKVDFGEKKAQFLKGKDDEKIVFNSMVDAMNYFGSQGWEFVQAYAISYSNGGVYHWLLKKKVSKEELEEAMKEENKK